LPKILRGSDVISPFSYSMRMLYLEPLYSGLEALKRTFVTNNMLEVSESITVFVLMLLFVLLNVVHQLIVGKDLFIVIIIDRANKLYVSRLPEEFTFVFTNTFANLLFIDNIEDLCTMSLPVFLIHEEGTTDKFQGINDRHRR
jgi:hypothetical protein